jgi:group I intron endonuclease
MGYIYKIRNIITNKCYIGETKKSNPLLRWNEHKSKIQKNIGCPALQDAVKKYGIENFTFTVLIICFDEDRYKYEMDYIKKYNTMAPNGYNLTPGGEGGGFYGKKHSQETINKISQLMKNRYLENPDLKNDVSIRNKIIMNNEGVKEKIKNGMKNSEKWQNAMKGGKRKNQTEETKTKIKEIVTTYFNNNENITKHRNIMSIVLGTKVIQYSINNEIINKYESINQASRQTGIPKSTIGKVIREGTYIAGNFIWKKE